MKNKIVAYIFIMISLMIMIVFIVLIYNDGYIFWGNTRIKYDITGQIGDFIGGIIGTLISAAAFWFLYLTLNEQRDSFYKERLESRLFELIKLHRDNVAELKFDGNKLYQDNDSLFIERRMYEGKAVFRVIFNQFVMCRNELKPFFQRKDDIYDPNYRKEISKIPYVIDNKIDIYTLAQIDICYNIVFYGVGNEGVIILKQLFKGKYNEKFICDMLNFITLKPAYDCAKFKKWKYIANRSSLEKRMELVNKIYEWRKKDNKKALKHYDEMVKFDNKHVKYYGGHQFRLGHYFRNAFQIIKYINEQTKIDYRIKYDYMKIFRAQLSNYEQAVLFFNSLSQKGRTWEILPDINKDLKQYAKHDFELITKYNLIKNVPEEKLYGIYFKKFYPEVEYENEREKKHRKSYK